MSDSEERIHDAEASAAERSRRRRLLLLTVVLMLGLPLYLLFASTVLGALTAPTAGEDGVEKPLHWAVELIIYVALGLVWVFPLKGLARGVARSGPDGGSGR